MPAPQTHCPNPGVPASGQVQHSNAPRPPIPRPKPAARIAPGSASPHRQPGHPCSKCRALPCHHTRPHRRPQQPPYFTDHSIQAPPAAALSLTQLAHSPMDSGQHHTSVQEGRPAPASRNSCTRHLLFAGSALQEWLSRTPSLWSRAVVAHLVDLPRQTYAHGRSINTLHSKSCTPWGRCIGEPAPAGRFPANRALGR